LDCGGSTPPWKGAGNSLIIAKYSDNYGRGAGILPISAKLSFEIQHFLETARSKKAGFRLYLSAYGHPARVRGGSGTLPRQRARCPRYKNSSSLSFALLNNNNAEQHQGGVEPPQSKVLRTSIKFGFAGLLSRVISG
jgi:hypothetical protein